MKTARDVGWTVRWRIPISEDKCSIPSCRRRAGPSYMGLTLCGECMDKHHDGKIQLYRYTDGEHSMIVIRDTPKGVIRLEVVDGGKLLDTVKSGDEVIWQMGKKTKRGIVESITGKGADTVNRVKKSCPISDTVIVWVRGDKGKKLALVPEEIVSLEEHEASIDDLLSAL